MQTNVINPPVAYQGSKRKLVPWIKENMPENVEWFIDAFGGSGVVSVNMVYNNINKVTYNELNSTVFQILSAIKNTEIEKIYEWVEEFMNHKLIKNYRRKDEYAKMTKEEKEETALMFYNMRTYLNQQRHNIKKKDIRKWWIWTIVFSKYEFAGRMRTDKDGKLIGTAGSGKPEKENVIKNFKNYKEQLDRIEMVNDSYTWIKDIEEEEKNVFIYLDPPYYNTAADYNSGWGEYEESELLWILNHLTNRGIKWMMSNTDNEHLYSFAKKNGYNIKEKEHYYVLGGGSRKVKEIIMTNYELPKDHQQLKLFE